MRRFSILFVFCMSVVFLCVDYCAARQPGGELGFIRQPISTRPQIVMPNDYITVDLDTTIHDKCSCAIKMYLEKTTGERIMLPGVTRFKSPVAVPIEGKTDADVRAYRYKALIPQNTEPGLYGLYVRKGAGNDLNHRAVMVVNEFPESYNILHISDTQAGRELDANATEKYTLLMDHIITEIEKVDPSIVIFTGDITSGSKPEEFKRFLKILDKINVPTYVTPGRGDAINNNSDAYFGPANYSFMFGDHLFVSIDTQLEKSLDAADETGRINWLKGVLGEHEEALLKILYTHRYENAPEALIDAIKPQRVDVVISGNESGKEVRQAGAPPVAFIETPAYANGFYRTIRIAGNKYSEAPLVILNRQSKYFIEHDAPVNQEQE